MDNGEELTVAIHLPLQHKSIKKIFGVDIVRWSKELMTRKNKEDIVLLARGVNGYVDGKGLNPNSSAEDIKKVIDIYKSISWEITQIIIPMGVKKEIKEEGFIADYEGI